MSAPAPVRPDVPAKLSHRLALCAAGATFVLILLGGLVTNTGAALAVPDWPTTFGQNMFLFPWSRMVGGIFYEHSHRLIGAAVGFLTLALAAALLRERAMLRALGLLAVIAVCAQGLVGGMRVVLRASTLAILHGSLAQAFFALLVAIAWLTAARAPLGSAMPRSLRALTVAAAALLYAQIVFGALLTHAGWLSLHLVGALAVYAIVPMITARLRRSGDPVAARAALTLLALLGLQLVLGVAALVVRFGALAPPGGVTTALVLPVAHRLVASLVLGVSLVAALRAHGAAATREPSRVPVARVA